MGAEKQLRDGPGGDNYDPITQRLLFDADEYGFRIESHKRNKCTKRMNMVLQMNTYMCIATYIKAYL